MLEDKNKEIVLKKKISCIICPLSCEITVLIDKMNNYEVLGSKCDRGKEYAISEITNPVRFVTYSVKVLNGDIPLVSLRTEKPIPKDKIFDCIKSLSKMELFAPLEIGQIIKKNVVCTGINVITTRKIIKII